MTHRADWCGDQCGDHCHRADRCGDHFDHRQPPHVMEISAVEISLEVAVEISLEVAVEISVKSSVEKLLSSVQCLV